jgi:hypothetical protein
MWITEGLQRLVLLQHSAVNKDAAPQSRIFASAAVFTN